MIALNLLPLMSTKIYKKAYGPRAEKCYFTPANSVLKFNFTPARAKICFISLFASIDFLNLTYFYFMV
jgi:hypothetical protein